MNNPTHLQIFDFVKNALSYQEEHYDAGDFLAVNEVTKANMTSLLNQLRDVDFESIDLETLKASEVGSIAFKAREDGKTLHIELGDLTFFIVVSSTSELLFSESYRINTG